VGVTALLPIVAVSAAQAPVNLRTAGSFAVLAGSGITNTGPTTITGDVGSFETPSVTGFDSVEQDGTNHEGDAVTQKAKTDLTTAYNEAAGSGPPAEVDTELGGRTLTPGVYGGPTLGITGTLTLDTLGDPAAVFIFQAGSTLITASSSKVIVLNGGTACNVFWQVGSSATLGTDSTLIGSVLATTSITATTGATIQGRLLAQNGAVTLDTNTITNTGCATGTPGGSDGGTPGGSDGGSDGGTTPGGSDGGTTPGGSDGGSGGTTPGGSDGGTTPGGSDGGSGGTTPGGSDGGTTPGGSDGGTPGGSDGGTTPGSTIRTALDLTKVPVTRVALAVTGLDGKLPLLGGLAVALGVSLLGLSSVLRRASGR
jgi:hypothetical protein